MEIKNLKLKLLKKKLRNKEKILREKQLNILKKLKEKF